MFLQMSQVRVVSLDVRTTRDARWEGAADLVESVLWMETRRPAPSTGQAFKVTLLLLLLYTPVFLCFFSMLFTGCAFQH